MMRKLKNAVLLTVAVAALISAEQKKFSLYGFMDATLSKGIINDDNPILWEGFDESMRFRVGNISLYNDFRPNDNIRVLIETGFHWQPHGTYYPGHILSEGPGGTLHPIKGQPIVPEGTIIDSSDKPETYKNTVDLTNSGGSEVPVYQISLPRAWLEYSINPQYANVRVGKFLTPAGIWNVDHGSPIIVTASQPYQTGLTPIFPINQTGLMESGTKYLGDFDLNYKVYISSGRDIQSIDSLKDLSIGGNLKFRAPWANGFEFGFSGYTGVEKKEDHYTIATGNTQFDQTFTPTGFEVKTFRDSVAPTRKVREDALGIDTKFEVKGLLLQGELNYNYAENLLEAGTSNVLGFYGLTGYKFKVHAKFSVMPYFLYERIALTSGERLGVVPLLGGYMDNIATIAGGLNLALFTNSHIKIEYRNLNFNKDSATSKYNDNMDFGNFAIQFAVAF